MPHNHITNETLPTPTTPTSKTWKELGVPDALIAARGTIPFAEKATSSSGSKTKQKPASPTKNTPAPAVAPQDRNLTELSYRKAYSPAEYACATDDALRAFIETNEQKKGRNWVERTNLAISEWNHRHPDQQRASHADSANTAKVKVDHNYTLEELSRFNDRQLKGYLGQNKSRKSEGWELRVELAELVLGQRGDVL